MLLLNIILCMTVFLYIVNCFHFFILKFLIFYQYRIFYKYYINNINYCLRYKSNIIVSNIINELVVIGIRKKIKTKLTIAISKNDNNIFTYNNILFKFLLKKSNIFVIYINDINQWDKNGILLIHNKYYMLVKPIMSYFIPLQVCGIENNKHIKSSLMNNIIYLSFFDKHYSNVSYEIFKKKIDTLNVITWDYYISLMPSIPEIWIQQCKSKKNKLIIADSTNVELTSYQFLSLTLSLSSILLDYNILSQKRIGICMPPSIGGNIAMMAVWLHGKTIVNLNYTSSVSSIQLAIDSANIKIIITSYKFISKLKNRGFNLDTILSSNLIILYLEDIKKRISKFFVLKKFLEVNIFSYKYLINKYVSNISIDDDAAILFSSGSEGVPKGVVLSHKNLIANVKQSIIAMKSENNDIVFSILPIFHAMGLTATTLLPLLEGLLMVCHPDPTDSYMLSKLLLKYRPTVLCGTSTFYRIYIKSKHLSYDHFKSLKYVVSGAEKLSDQVRENFELKFKKVIYEGYGATELSPVASVNRPTLFNNKYVVNNIGTVGCVVPGGKFIIVDPDTMSELPCNNSGLIIYGGVNVMSGYLNNDRKTKESIFLKNNIRWYKTGDKGKLNINGCLIVEDRYSRFAKVGGEMVSLTSLENNITNILDIENKDYELLAISTSDDRKGEIISLLYNLNISSDIIKNKINASNMINLYKPRYYFYVHNIPKLGSGKIDFSSSKKLVLKLIADLK